MRKSALFVRKSSLCALLEDSVEPIHLIAKFVALTIAHVKVATAVAVNAILLQPTEAAYIAGFLDGDGSIYLYKRNRKARLRVAFANCKRDILDWILTKTGVGNIIEKPIHNSKHRRAYLLFINSDAASSMLNQVIPYLTIKQPQATLALWFQKRMSNPTWNSQTDWQQDAKAQMQELNRRGPRQTSKQYQPPAVHVSL